MQIEQCPTYITNQLWLLELGIEVIEECIDTTHSNPMATRSGKHGNQIVPKHIAIGNVEDEAKDEPEIKLTRISEQTFKTNIITNLSPEQIDQKNILVFVEPNGFKVFLFQRHNHHIHVVVAQPERRFVRIEKNGGVGRQTLKCIGRRHEHN